LAQYDPLVKKCSNSGSSVNGGAAVAIILVAMFLGVIAFVAFVWKYKKPAVVYNL
jgi:hypothetical protein